MIEVEMAVVDHNFLVVGLVADTHSTDRSVKISSQK
jgi:hypothetical protein